jgi:autotransporter-associated beta strand protein
LPQNPSHGNGDVAALENSGKFTGASYFMDNPIPKEKIRVKQKMLASAIFGRRQPVNRERQENEKLQTVQPSASRSGFLAAFPSPLAIGLALGVLGSGAARGRQNAWSRSDAGTNLWENNTNLPWNYEGSQNHRNRPDLPFQTRNHVLFGHDKNLVRDANTTVWFQFESLTMQSTATGARTFNSSVGGAGISLNWAFTNESGTGGNLTKEGSGTLTLEDHNTDTRTTTIDGGTLELHHLSRTCPAYLDQFSLAAIVSRRATTYLPGHGNPCPAAKRPPVRRKPASGFPSKFRLATPPILPRGPRSVNFCPRRAEIRLSGGNLDCRWHRER